MAAVAFFIHNNGSSVQENNLNSLATNIPPHLFRGLEGREPLIIQLPAEDAARRAIAAQISGRAVLVRDENGVWGRLEPVRDANGKIQDASETFGKISKLMCGNNSAEDDNFELPEMTEEQRLFFCETFPEEAKKY